MRKILRLLLLAAAWCGLAPAASAQPRPDLLVLVSIDGFRADYLQRGKTPVLSALAAQGVHAAMRPSFPSLTFPNHYTLVTGLTPDHNGVVDNTMDDPAIGHFTEANSVDPRWWEQGEPLWVTADNQGLRTATMFWPGSDRVIHGRQPDYWKAYDKKFLADDRVTQVLAWLDLAADQRPVFVTLYFDLVDTQGHRYGPEAVETDAALASTDAALGRLVDGLKARGLFDRANLIVTADHGMADTSDDRLVFIDDVAGGAAAIKTATAGASAGLALTPQASKDTLAKLLAFRGHARCWEKADIPAPLKYGKNPRVPPIVCLADPGWYITTHARVHGSINKGSHGYDPRAPEMAAVFVAEGPAFKRGLAMPAFDNVDVQPLMARLLNLKAPTTDGSAATFASVLSAH